MTPTFYFERDFGEIMGIYDGRNEFRFYIADNEYNLDVFKVIHTKFLVH